MDIMKNMSKKYLNEAFKHHEELRNELKDSNLDYQLRNLLSMFSDDLTIKLNGIADGEERMESIVKHVNKLHASAARILSAMIVANTPTKTQTARKKLSENFCGLNFIHAKIESPTNEEVSEIVDDLAGDEIDEIVALFRLSNLTPETSDDWAYVSPAERDELYGT